MIGNKEWMELTLSLLRELSDPEFQERVWLRGDGPEVSSWEEATNSFLDHVNPDGFLEKNWKQLGLSAVQRDALMSLASALEEYNPRERLNPKPQFILTDKKWQNVRETAREVLELVNGSQR